MEFKESGVPPAIVPTMQIIVFALTMGLVSFLLIVVFAIPGNAGGGQLLLTPISVGFCAVMVLVRAVAVRVVATSGRRTVAREVSREKASANMEDDTACRLFALYQTRMIVGAACLEGAGFFTLIAYMSERSPWALAGAIAMILGVAAHFPTQRRVRDFIERQTKLLEEERQFQSSP